MKKVILYSSMWIFITILIFMIFICSIEDSAVQIPPGVKKTTNLLFPEGWSFFTRSPREELADIYKISEDKSIDKISSQCASPGNFYGISRKSRKIGMELSTIVSKINDSSWVQMDISKAGTDSLPVLSIPLDSEAEYLLKGNYILKAETPVPWAWSGNKNTKSKTRVIRIKII
jgi:antimicrobial peptide system SdpA family protein